MDAVIRAPAVYLFPLLVLRLSGTRSLAQITAFDFVLLLIISEATQQALVGDDFSVTNSFIVVLTPGRHRPNGRPLLLAAPAAPAAGQRGGQQC